MLVGLFVSLVISIIVYEIYNEYKKISIKIDHLKQNILNDVDGTTLGVINCKFDLIRKLSLYPSHVKALEEVRVLLKQLNTKYKFTTTSE